VERLLGNDLADVRDVSGARSLSERPVSGRRVADRPVDSSISAHGKPYVGRRVALVPGAGNCETIRPEITRAGERASVRLDTSEIERVLAELEPADQSTSFAHEPTVEIPMFRPEPARSTPGKRRAVKHAGSRGPLFKGLPSGPVLLGVAALAVSIGGVLSGTDAGMVSNDGGHVAPASALSGTAGVGTVADRGKDVSRDSDRTAQSDAAGEELVQEAEGLAEQRNTRLRQLANAAEDQSKIIAKNLWQYPTSTVQLTARFGQYGLWSGYHTGLDFNGNTGDPIMAIANGVVISTGYDGSYGNKTVVQLEDGTEIWYCHQNAFGVSVGDNVRGGEVIGYIGSTGHVTGSHLHVEVRPGGGDPVDPYLAMQQHGLF
jgi:murein DD-endopeptidase MepM/ murein hydrolase activator NlpD